MFHEARRTIEERSIKVSINEIFYLSIPLIVFVISTLYWGNILWLKYNSLHDYVFDSGVFLDSLYQILYFHTSATLISYLGSSPDRIIFAPLSYFHSILFLLYFQLIAVLGSTFIVFFTLKTLTKNSVISSVVSVLYLIYFPIDGSLFFDVHAQTFFIPFFLLGFMFQAMNKKFLSILFFLLAGMTRFPLIGIVVLYSMLDFIRNYRLHRKNTTINGFKQRANYDTLLFGMSFSVLLFEYLIEHDLNGVQVVSSGYLHVQSSGILSNLSSKVITVFFFTAPFLFLVLYVNEFAIILWGLFGFIFYANYTPYYYPSIFTDQYSAIFTAVIFLIIIVYLAEYYYGINQEKATSNSIKSKLHKIRSNPVLKIAVAVIIFAIILEPISPISTNMGTHFDIGSYTTFGNSNVTAVMEMASLIPSNESGVIIQGDLPQVLTHDYNINPNLVGEVNGYPYNYTPSYFNNSTSINYIFGYLGYSSFSYSTSGLSQYSIIQNALYSGKYGVLSENGQLILLERNYKGLPKIFSKPDTIVIHKQDLVSIQHPQYAYGILNNTSSSLFYDNSFILLPGTYNVNVSVKQYSPNSNISLDFGIYGHLDGNDTINKVLTIKTFNNYLSFSFPSRNVYLNRYLSISVSNISSELVIENISISQLN